LRFAVRAGENCFGELAGSLTLRFDLSLDKSQRDLVSCVYSNMNSKRPTVKTTLNRFSYLVFSLALTAIFSSLTFAQTETESKAKPTQEETKPAKAKGEQDASKEEGAKDEEEAVPDPIVVKLADDTLLFRASGTWKSVPPRSRMLEAELKIPREGEDEADGRLTIMGAGGTIEANIVRWQGQFVQPDGSSTAEKTKQEKKEINGQTVNLVDISGTFMDSVGGPFSGKPKVERTNYRMLAAIVQTEDKGNYFVKLYGPKATIDKNADHFKSMIESLRVAD
jgi:hypothetical protein